MSGKIAERMAEMEALKATMEASALKISEAETDYAKEIERLKEQKTARETIATSEIGRTREMGIAMLTERGAQAKYETEEAMRKAAQTVSAAESRIGAGGVRASGTALASAQQQADIAYAGAQRVAEAGAAQMKIGGLQLKSQLQSGQEQKSLLSMEYGQKITEQQRKLTELQKNKSKYLEWTFEGGAAGLQTNFYSPTADVLKLALAFL